MRPFDLERALAGDKVITRNGQEVTQLHLFKDTNYNAPLIGIINKNIFHWTDKGYFVPDYDRWDHSMDLFMVPTKKTLWFNVYQYFNKNYGTGCATYISKEDAESNVGTTDRYIGTFSIEVEE